jgi:tyrosyl-tRNA synthetase
MMLKHLHLSGHNPIVLLGGFTGMIGDPSDKSAERNFLSDGELRENMEMLRKQFAKFLDFDCGLLSAFFTHERSRASVIIG